LASTSPFSEKVLHLGAGGVIGDDIEFVPQAVDLLLTFFGEDELAQRRVPRKTGKLKRIIGLRMWLNWQTRFPVFDSKSIIDVDYLDQFGRERCL
jgi:hypothetical protein